MANPEIDVFELFHNILTVKTEPIKAGSKVLIDWPYKALTKDLVEDTKGNCGCTKPEVLDDRIRAIYTNGDSSKDIEKSGGAKVVSKSVTVYLKDGEELEITNKKGVKQFNPNKAAVTLTFHVTVVP
jgi:hypothetical protein